MESKVLIVASKVWPSGQFSSVQSLSRVHSKTDLSTEKWDAAIRNAYKWGGRFGTS